jgi:hypothetical protein
MPPAAFCGWAVFFNFAGFPKTADPKTAFAKSSGNPIRISKSSQNPCILLHLYLY